MRTKALIIDADVQKIRVTDIFFLLFAWLTRYVFYTIQKLYNKVQSRRCNKLNSIALFQILTINIDEFPIIASNMALQKNFFKRDIKF